MRILTDCNLAQLVADILNGQTVVFPTETSYGLGCCATNQAAVDRVFKIKGRPSDKPLLVVVPSVEAAKEYLVWNELLEKVADKYWPGGLTVVGEYRRNPLLVFPLKRGGGLASPPFKEGTEGWSRHVGGRLLGYSWTIPLRKELRANKTETEKRLWSHLRLKRLSGLRFRRQHGIGPFIVDFYQAESKTIIEVDGDVHFIEEAAIQKDKRRQLWLEKHGYKILRYNNVDIFNNLRWVLEEIYNAINRRLSETPPRPPLKRGGGECSPSFQGGGRGRSRRAITCSRPRPKRRHSGNR